MISTRFFMSAIALLIVVQCTTCLDKTDTNVGATKPNMKLYIGDSKSESLSDEEETTEDNSEEKTMTSSVRSLITYPVEKILSPIKGVFNSLKNVAKKFNPLKTANDEPLENSTK
ncbi:uncharacterized protein LOC112601848 [Melanaphis sacchari]|uniref:uncharacterized protein LOC112601848 n=1 Tax=Melanaphis sacchari TaxID=742174 RepID=UPI000DC15016|nr:uncharacterized protein LOC112601848 [Melanaphis sacchari]